MSKDRGLAVMRGLMVMCVTGTVLLSSAWSDNSVWHEVGPGGGGSLQDFAFDPFDVDRVYLTSDTVGVFVSNDAGENWRWSSYGASNQKGSIAVDPGSPGVIYSVGPDGIYRSTDRAGRWQLIYSKGNGYQGVNNQRFGVFENSIYGKPGQAVSVDHKGVVYVCTVVGDVIISRDRGRHWDRVSIYEKGEVRTVIPVDGNKVVAALFEEGIFLSRDEGLTWERVLSPERGGLVALAIHPVRKEMLYAIVGKPSVFNYIPEYSVKSFPAYLFRSDDGGETWKLVYTFDKLAFRKGRRIMDISKNGTIIILPAGEPYRSTDGGSTWERSRLVSREDDGYIYAVKGKWTSDKLSIYADSRKEGRWFMTGMTAALRSDDDGRTWHYKVNGLRQDLYKFVKVNPVNPSMVIASDIDHGLIRSTDRGQTWKDIVVDSPYEECDQLRFSPNDETFRTAYALFNHRNPFIAKSSDAGENWSILKRWEGEKGSFARFCTTKGRELPIMYVGEPGMGIWMSVDEGKTWQMKNRGLPDSNKISSIEFLESDVRGHLYAGLTSKVSSESGIYRSTDGGDTWVSINQGLESGSVRSGSFEVDPNNPDILWVGAGRSVYRSNNGGVTWEKRIEGVYSSAILVEPGDSNIVYVASFTGGGILEQYTAGIYKSVDGGNYFFDISGELFKTIGSSYRVYDLEYGWKESGMIWAAPYSGGLIYTAPAVMK